MLLLLAALQPAISASLRTLGYARTRVLMERNSRGAGSSTADAKALGDAQRLAELARIAGRHGLVETSCLRQSLAVYWLLRRRGFKPELKLGVDQIRGALPDMHAWVELQGRALAQPKLRHAAFSASTASRQADTAPTTSGKRA